MWNGRMPKRCVGSIAFLLVLLWPGEGSRMRGDGN